MGGDHMLGLGANGERKQKVDFQNRRKNKKALLTITLKYDIVIAKYIGGVFVNEKDIVKEAMKTLGWNQTQLAEATGYKTQSAISNRLTGNSMRVDTFVKMLAAMGYEVVVKSTSPQKNKNQWTISYND